MQHLKIFKVLGVGKFQIRNYILSCLPVFVSGSLISSLFFLSFVPEHRCFVDVCDDGESLQWNISNFAIPWNGDSYEKCIHYRILSPTGGCKPGNFNKNATQECSRYVYQDYPFKVTLVSQFDLVCARSYMTRMLPAILFSALLLGSFIFGALSDSRGRLFVYKFAPIPMFVSLVITSFLNNIWLVMAFLLITSIGCLGIFQSAFVLGMELARGKAGKYRFICGNMSSVVFAWGGLYCTFLAWLFGSWNMIVLFNSFPVLLLIPLPKFMQESLVWLVSKAVRTNDKEQLKQFNELILMAAKENQVTIDQDSVDKELELEGQHIRAGEDAKITWKVFYQDPTLLIYTLVMVYIWFTTSQAYYTIGYLANDISLDFYLSFTILSVIEMLGVLVLTLLGHKVKRRPLLTLLMLLCGAGCIVCGFAAKRGNVKMAGVFVGKACVSAAFSLVYVYAMEFLPTPVRQTGLAICYAGARLANIVVPFILLLKSRSKELPFIVIGSLAVIAGFLIWPLPETKGKPLPDTIKDVDSIDLPTSFSSSLSSNTPRQYKQMK